MKKRMIIMALVIASVFAFMAGSSQASILLTDNFDGENGGVGSLNYNSFANWNVTGGTVDLIGNGNFEFYPGNGLYVDLDGSTNQPGLFASNTVFSPGTYLIQFTLGGSVVDVNTSEIVTVKLGNTTLGTLTLPWTQPLTQYSFLVTTATGGSLSFQNNGNDNMGAILTDVKVSSVPIPPTAYLFVTGLVGLYGIGRRRFKK